MDITPVPHTPAAAAAIEQPRLLDEDIPLGWECAFPALQIERWGLDDGAPPSSKS